MTDGLGRVWVERMLSALVVLAVGGAIFALTIQSPEGTMGLSVGFSRALARLFGFEGVPDQYLMRKIGHTIEFFFMGLAVFWAVEMWSGGAVPRGRRLAITLSICAASSLFDQTHKLFVTGREFDVLDLPFDVLGYSLAIGLGALFRRF